MSKVGIIANPAAGKDIRRLVAYASLVDNREKTDLVRRIILGISSTGVDEILIMPDYHGLGERALSGIGPESVSAKVTILDMAVSGTQEDSTNAMRLMKELGVGCVVTVGGDGTNRAVAKGDRTIPLVPVSTGTNNVFPVMVEATTAGIAAGIAAKGVVDLDKVVTTHKRLITLENGTERDMALIDVVVLEQPFIGARAVWKLSEVKQVICTRAQPDSLGLSCIGGSVCPVGPEDDYGMSLKLGEGSLRARAAVLPGVVQEVGIEEVKLIRLGEEVEVTFKPSLMALDGERELKVNARDEVKVRLERDGPRVVDINRAIKEAATKGFFIRRN
jgi:predicted polyphosphate/ATP-dependent NAD kinase